MDFTGRPRSEFNVNDLSILISAKEIGVAAVLGATERGEIGKAILCKNFEDFKLHFGDLPENWANPQDTLFPLLCKRAFEAGTSLLVARSEHYTDAEDKTTGTSEKAVAKVKGIKFTSTQVGDYACEITIGPAASGIVDLSDISVKVAGAPKLSKTYPDVPAIIDATLSEKISEYLYMVSLTAGTILDLLVETVVDTSAGSYDMANIVSADYIGDLTAGTGIHIFDEYTVPVRIAVPETAEPDVNHALIDYAEMRRDLRAILRAPLGIDGYTAKDYRNGEGLYSHDAFDSHLASLTYGGLKIKHPITGLMIDIPVIADVLGAKGKRDVKAKPWFSSSGSKYPVGNSVGVVYNLGTTARKDEHDEVANAGINSTIEHGTFGVVHWGGNTLQKKRTLLSHENVSELVVTMRRDVLDMVDVNLFDPNDLITWKSIYRKVSAYLQNLIEGRAINAWVYQGDQEIDKIEDAVINDPADIDLGGYTANIWFKPIVALKYIGFEVNITNTSVDIVELAEKAAE